MRICVKRYLHRSRVVEHLIEDWKAGQIQPAGASCLAAIVAECIDVVAFCLQSWEYIQELLRTDPNGDAIDAVGKIMKSELPRTLAALDSVQELIGKMTSSPIKDATAFEAAANQIRAVHAKVEMVFPELNKEMAEESLAEFTRGEYQTVEELIREIQGHSVPAH